MKEELRKLPKIDEQGVPIPAPLVPQPTAPTGENLLASLMDSKSFTEAAAQLDPEDTAAMQKLIKEHIDPAPKMQPNPLQGGGKAAQAPKPKMTLMESLAAQFGPEDQFARPGQNPIH